MDLQNIILKSGIDWLVVLIPQNMQMRIEDTVFQFSFWNVEVCRQTLSISGVIISGEFRATSDSNKISQVKFKIFKPTDTELDPPPKIEISTNQLELSEKEIVIILKKWWTIFLSYKNRENSDEKQTKKQKNFI